MISATKKYDVEKGFDSAAWMLIGANLIPLAGVLLWGWSTFEVVVLYWLENVIIGGINILKMLSCSPDPEKLDLESILNKRVKESPGMTEEELKQVQKVREMIGKYGDKVGLLNHGSKLFFIPFFTFPYGMFCAVHGVFVFVLLGGDGGSGGFLSGGPDLDKMPEMIQEAVAQGGIWAVLALAISHLFSFAANFIGKGEYRRTAVPMIMMAPYGRIVVLHIAILFGAFAIMALGSPVALLVLLIIGKIVLDLKLHLRAHRKLAKDIHANTPGS